MPRLDGPKAERRVDDGIGVVVCDWSDLSERVTGLACVAWTIVSFGIRGISRRVDWYVGFDFPVKNDLDSGK